MSLELAVVGDPIDHSLSPLIHQAALDHLGIAGRYGRRRVVEAAGMDAIIAELLDGRLDGVNVTMPHKRTAAALAGRLTATAARTGSVNTLWVADGAVVGDTTDVVGVRRAWEWAELPEGGPVLVLGAGGAAAAALLALEERRLVVSARRPERARATAAAVGVQVEAVPWGRGVQGAVVVNATPLGMAGERLPEPVMAGAGGLLDMTYGHGPSPAVTEMRSTGRPVAAGESMLVGQAAASFSIWTGVASPHEVMLKALHDRAGG